jgi:hypothetical protein
MPKSDIKEIAAALADIVSRYNGKTEAQIRRSKNAEAQKAGVDDGLWDDENPIPRDAAARAKVAERFDGKGPVKIEEELNDMTEAELSEYRVLAKNLSFLL